MLRLGRKGCAGGIDEVDAFRPDLLENRRGTVGGLALAGGLVLGTVVWTRPTETDQR